MTTPAHFNDDIPGLIGDVIRKGVIASVDLSQGLAVVMVGDVESPPLPWFELAGAISTWCPPSIDEQVIILCMEGDIESGVILRGLRTDLHPAPITGARVHLKMPDGTTFDYDYGAHELTLTVAAGGKTRIISPVEIEGDVKITGDVEIGGETKGTGKITSDTDVVAGSISLKSHKTLGVTPGSGLSGLPQ